MYISASAFFDEVSQKKNSEKDDNVSLEEFLSDRYPKNKFLQNSDRNPGMIIKMKK